MTSGAFKIAPGMGTTYSTQILFQTFKITIQVLTRLLY